MDNEYKTERKCHVLLVYLAMIPSVRLCGHAQFEYLNEQGLIEYRAVQEMRIRTQDLNWADVVVFCRADSWYEHKLAEIIHASGRKLVYVIDDDLLNVPPGLSSSAHYRNGKVQDRIRNIMDLSDVIISPSPILLDKYAIDGKTGIRLEEPALAPVEYAQHDPLNPVKIGFAGSMDRTNDIETILKDVLRKVKERYGDNVSIEFFGAKPDFIESIGGGHIPYCNSYDDYREKLNSLEWDIGLAPMPDTPFHACKHYNKFCEYAAAGIAGIYSDAEPYTFIPEREKIGRFCENDPDAWVNAICCEIEDRKALEQHRMNNVRAAQSILSVRSISTSLYDNCLQLFRANKSEDLKRFGLRRYKLNNLLQKGFEYIDRHGLSTPVYLFRKIKQSVR